MWVFDPRATPQAGPALGITPPVGGVMPNAGPAPFINPVDDYIYIFHFTSLQIQTVLNGVMLYQKYRLMVSSFQNYIEN